MVKSYAKFALSRSFGVVSSATSNIVWTADSIGNSTSSTGAGRAIVPANEDVLCWDIKKGELLSRWRDTSCKAAVTAISQSKIDPDVFAVGYILDKIPSRVFQQKRQLANVFFSKDMQM